jgi:hypothetical protein
MTAFPYVRDADSTASVTVGSLSAAGVPDRSAGLLRDLMNPSIDVFPVAQSSSFGANTTATTTTTSGCEDSRVGRSRSVRPTWYETTCISHFGYVNIKGCLSTISIEDGENNFITPAPVNRGQPTTFQPSGAAHAFSVIHDCQQILTWTLNNVSIAVNASATDTVIVSARGLQVV